MVSASGPLSIRMSIGWVSDSGSLLHSPTVPCTVWYGYACASSFSYVPLALSVSSTRARTCAPEAIRSRAVPAGSGLAAPTLCSATVRSPVRSPPWRDLSPKQPTEQVQPHHHRQQQRGHRGGGAAQQGSSCQHR